MKFDYAKEPGRELLNSNRVSNDKSSVSIITPYYNAGKYFEQTFNCVMNQTFPWFEWIIVDDGSTDKPSLDTLERLSIREFAFCISPIKDRLLRVTLQLSIVRQILLFHWTQTI